MDSDIREEIERILRGSGDGLSHGATFRLNEAGFSPEEIAAKRRVQVDSTKVFLRSLDQLFAGVIPQDKTPALTNSYVYRELLHYKLSPKLASYVQARLRELHAINPEVSFDPLETRAYQYGRGGQRSQQREMPDDAYCQDCKAIGLLHVGECP